MSFTIDKFQELIDNNDTLKGVKAIRMLGDMDIPSKYYKNTLQLSVLYAKEAQRYMDNQCKDLIKELCRYIDQEGYPFSNVEEALRIASSKERKGDAAIIADVVLSIFYKYKENPKWIQANLWRVAYNSSTVIGMYNIGSMSETLPIFRRMFKNYLNSMISDMQQTSE